MDENAAPRIMGSAVVGACGIGEPSGKFDGVFRGLPLVLGTKLEAIFGPAVGNLI